MDLNVDASELKALARDLAQAPKIAVARGVRLTKKTAYDIERDGKIGAAVDTGNMRDGISTDSRGLWAEIGPVADYSEHVEDGTSVMAPQPFMGPAAQRNTPAYVEGWEQIMGGIL